MKTILFELPETVEKIEIHPLADLHIGDSCCSFDLVKKELEYIKNTENCFCMLDGDLMDAAISSSVGDTYGANVKPMEQLRLCVKIFEPIKDKIIAVVGGNHENRIYKSDGIDITQIMCSQLGIEKRYSATTALSFVRLGKNEHAKKVCYSVYMTHGHGGGRKEGGKIQQLSDLSGIVDADVYVMAHVHQPASFRCGFFRADPRNNCAQKVEHLFVNTAAWLEYGGYGDRNGYRPASNVNPVIVLSGKSKSARAIT